MADIPAAPPPGHTTGWDDLGRVFGGPEPSGDIVVELIPIPMVRLSTEQ